MWDPSGQFETLGDETGEYWGGGWTDLGTKVGRKTVFLISSSSSSESVSYSELDSAYTSAPKETRAQSAEDSLRG